MVHVNQDCYIIWCGLIADQQCAAWSILLLHDCSHFTHLIHKFFFFFFFIHRLTQLVSAYILCNHLSTTLIVYYGGWMIINYVALM